MPPDDRKQAEIDYPSAIGEEGRGWLRKKPFASIPDETARLLIDFAHVVQLLELEPGMSLCELGCGSGWISRLATRHGVRAEGYDISPEMIEIAREVAAEEGLDVTYDVGDMEQLDLGRRFDTCLLYDALHHSPRADLVLASARRALTARRPRSSWRSRTGPTALPDAKPPTRTGSASSATRRTA